ncbi:chemotaxis protein CheA [Evansella sp. LMS18]|uniref:chemotaxis protein CheA n=1 Tax=Evansella sp. LMS18 TaxID=2924033 RepID=UPI0020D095C6|nr:chemotaxis protein CheA [Evansella sp. LMS18]UTR12076.1 chemotaxis protein CheA [Evansella sp. LMS18]
MDTMEYIDMFLDESREHLQAVNDHLLVLEKNPSEVSLVNEIFRSAHTLKGMAATMQFEDIASLTHQMENVLDLIRNEKLSVTTEVIDITFEAVESLEEMVEDISRDGTGKKDVSHLVSRLEQIEKRSSSEPNNPAQMEPPSLPSSDISLDEYQDTVVNQAKEQGYQAMQLNISLQEDCLLKAVRVFMVFEVLDKAGEVIKAVPSVEELEQEEFDRNFSVILLTEEKEEVVLEKILKISEVAEVTTASFTPAKEESENSEKTSDESESENESAEQSQQRSSKTIRVNLERIDGLMNLFEEMVIDRGRLEDLSQKIGNKDLIETVEHLARISQDMQGMMLTMRMVPVEQVFNRFPRMVRGLAKDLNKEIQLEIIGAETELDRTVVDEIGDPLVHLIRNSIDHGIETPEKRKEEGKTEAGTLTLRAYHSGNSVFIEIEDDGAGINREKVMDKAIANGLLTQDRAEQLTKDKIENLIFSSGFSTAETVSDISGRGVGLDVVRSKIESLGGQIAVESEPGRGSKFSIQLPLTLSILSVLLVKVADETYGVPLSSIEETVLLNQEHIKYIQKNPVMDFRGKVIPIVSLAEILNTPGNEAVDSPVKPVVVVKKGEKMAGLVVDSFIGQKEVVLKSLGSYLQDIFAISGATILGDGGVSLIIDPNALIK